MRRPAFPLFAAASAALHVAVAVVAVRGVRVAPAPAVRPVAPAPALAGDTFALNGDDGREVDLDEVPDPTADPTPDSTADPASDPTSTRAPHPTPIRIPIPRKRPRGRAVPAAASAAPGDPGPAADAMYGAVGERGVTDLATTFTRTFPNIASLDPVWAKVPLGDAGSADVTLTIDETGKIIGSSISGGASPALRSGIAGTIGLIRGRTFTAHAATTHLHVTARVSPGEVRPAVNENAYGVGGSFTGVEGNAFFRLPIGRDVDVRIRVK